MRLQTVYANTCQVAVGCCLEHQERSRTKQNHLYSSSFHPLNCFVVAVLAAVVVALVVVVVVVVAAAAVAVTVKKFMKQRII